MDCIDLKWEDMDGIEAIVAVRKIADPLVLTAIAKDCIHSEASYEALERITESALLKDIMENASNDVIRMVAAESALDEAIRTSDDNLVASIIMTLTSVDIAVDVLVEASMAAFQKVIEGASDELFIEKIAQEILRNIKAREFNALLSQALDHTDDQSLLQDIIGKGRSEYSIKIRTAAIKKITGSLFLEEVIRDENQEFNVRLAALDSLHDHAAFKRLIDLWLPSENYVRLFDLAIGRIDISEIELLSTITLQACYWDHQMTAWRRIIECPDLSLEDRQVLFHSLMQSKTRAQEIYQLVKTIPPALFSSFDLETIVREYPGEDEFGKYIDMRYSVAYRGVELFESA